MIDQVPVVGLWYSLLTAPNAYDLNCSYLLDIEAGAETQRLLFRDSSIVKSVNACSMRRKSYLETLLCSQESDNLIPMRRFVASSHKAAMISMAYHHNLLDGLPTVSVCWVNNRSWCWQNVRSHAVTLSTSAPVHWERPKILLLSHCHKHCNGTRVQSASRTDTRILDVFINIFPKGQVHPPSTAQIRTYQPADSKRR